MAAERAPVDMHTRPDRGHSSPDQIRHVGWGPEHSVWDPKEKDWLGVLLTHSRPALQNREFARLPNVSQIGLESLLGWPPI